MQKEVNNSRLGTIVNELLKIDERIIRNHNYSKINDVFDSKYHYRLSNSFIKEFLEGIGIVKK